MSWQREWIAALAEPTVWPPGLLFPQDVARFAIYRASFEANLGRALADTFPATERLLGETFFRQRAGVFLRTHPSHSGDIHAWGGEFPAFLRGLTELADLPWLADVARLEWQLHRAFHAADAVPLTVAGLANLPEADYGAIQLLPSVRLMASAWPVHHIWRANHTADGDAVNGDAAKIDLAAGAVRLAIWRDGDALSVLPLDAPAWALVRALDAQGDLGRACACLEDAATLGGALHTLVDAGLLAAPCGPAHAERTPTWLR